MKKIVENLKNHYGNHSVVARKLGISVRQYLRLRNRKEGFPVPLANFMRHLDKQPAAELRN